MDEGLNSFMEFMAEDELGLSFKTRSQEHCTYMSGEKILGAYHVKFRV
jgi:hypothetical protein